VRITKTQLRKIIKEEKQKLLEEGNPQYLYGMLDKFLQDFRKAFPGHPLEADILNIIGLMDETVEETEQYTTGY
tara:strand:- start:813 stop:1034 length:222 start_codon:yes stop_codon:yes gene_type:complete